MVANGECHNESIELDPNDWLFWKDEEFNNWRRRHDFPRVVNFLFESLPYFSLWLHEQVGLTEDDLLFHGPSRFIKSYGGKVIYITHDVGVSLFEDIPAREIVRYKFVAKNDAEEIELLKVLREVEFVSYFDWACSNKHWAFPNKMGDFRELAQCFAPSGRASKPLDFLNSSSWLEFNIPMFMPNLPVKCLSSNIRVEPPPRLQLLKLGGGEQKVTYGLIGEKNLEFANIDNLTLIAPMITSFQTISFSTLRNLKIIGSIHALTLHQCSTEMVVHDGDLSSCHFEYGSSKIELYNSVLRRSSIRARQLNLKLSDAEILDCRFEYCEPFSFLPEKEREFHRVAKMIYSHLGYPDLAGKHFFLEKKSERRSNWEIFSRLKRGVGIRSRLRALLGFFRMFPQELYWGYGEKPFYIIVTSAVTVLAVSLLGYLEQSSSTYGDAVRSIIFAFQSFTNISISEVDQVNDGINMIGAVMSFFGLMSVGLLIASLSSKSKDYN